MQINRTDAGATIRFLASSNKTFTVQYTDRVPSGQWLNLTDLAAHPTNCWVTISDFTSTTNRYYRLATPAR